MLACWYAIADAVNEGGYHEPELGAEYREQEPEIPNPEQELLEDFEDDKLLTVYNRIKLHMDLQADKSPVVDECGIAEIGNSKEETHGTQFRQVRAARCVIPYVLYAA
jgi:hypothetical protein